MSETVTIDTRQCTPVARRAAWLLLCLSAVGLLCHQIGYQFGYATGEAACPTPAPAAAVDSATPADGKLFRAAHDPIGYATELTVATISGSGCPVTSIATPVLQASDACELSDAQWAYIIDFYTGRNNTEVEHFLDDETECTPVTTDVSTLGRPQLTGCPFELRVLASVAWARGPAKLPAPPSSRAPAQAAAISRLKAFFAVDASPNIEGSMRMLRYTCEAVLDCEDCLLGFRVDWGCVRKRLRCAYIYVKNCGMWQEDFERDYCESLARCALG